LQSPDKNLLLVSYYFPPMGLGGVQRAAKTAKYLARSGWDVTVLTCRHEGFPLYDDSLLNDLPEGVEIVRVPDPAGISRKSGSSEEYILKTGSGLLQRLVRVPDAKALWASNAIEKAANIIKEKAINYVMTTSPPPSVNKLGIRLKNDYGIRWLADFRDPWFADELEPITPFHARLRNRLETDIVSNADVITSVTSSHCDDLISRFPDHRRKIHYVPNGYDPEDFGGLTESNPPKLIFAHCGTLCSRYGVEAFFAGLQKLIAADSGFADRIEFWQVGAVNDDIHDLLTEKYSGKIEIKFSGYLEHKDALGKLAQSSAVVVFGGVSRDSTRVIPAKLYEGLALPKPLAAVVPKDSAVFEVIADMPGVYHLDTDKSERVESALKEIISAYNSGTLFHDSRESLIQRYSRKVQAEEMGKLLEDA
jgi:glycosyltransferase involved in cell wall biosynthesis